MNYLFHLLIMINIYFILALSLNLIVGYAGMLSLCHAAFYGVGAYISTLLSVNFKLPFLVSLVVAVICTSLLSLIISIPSLRLKSDYFVLASIGFQSIVFTLLYNWVSLTNGPYGISGIPSPSFMGIEINSTASYFIYSVIISLVCIFLFYLIVNSPFGRVLKAIREDEMAAAMLGKNVPKFKVITFAIAASYAAVAGVLFAGYMQYIDPTSFTVMESIFILSIIIIGGTGNLLGSIVGAVIMILLPEVLRFLKIPDSIAPNMRQIIYGVTIILIMRYRPQGLFGEYKFE